MPITHLGIKYIFGNMNSVRKSCEIQVLVPVKPEPKQKLEILERVKNIIWFR
jgi:hypothetical protein